MRLVDYDEAYAKAHDLVHRGKLEWEEFSDIINFLDSMQIIDAEAVQRWIPVTERLPHKEWEEATENGMDLYPCLVVERYKGFEPVATKGWYDGKGFINAVSIDVSAVITHWMPLPDASMEDSNA